MKKKPPASPPTRRELTEFRRWSKEHWQRCQELRVGDEIRVVRMPSYWNVPWITFHRDTARLYRKLLTRKRPLKIAYIDEFGAPWIKCRIRGRDGRMEHHSLLIDDDSWVRVRKRQPRTD